MEQEAKCPICEDVYFKYPCYMGDQSICPKGKKQAVCKYNRHLSQREMRDMIQSAVEQIKDAKEKEEEIDFLKNIKKEFANG
jgi:hypothetical protein